MSDGASRLLTLSVLGSPFHGKTVDVAAVDEVLIGSDPGCSLHIDHPGVSPIHARLWVEETGATVYDTKSPTGVFINFDRVEGQALLHEGDMIWLGPPQEPGSVLIQCTFGVLHPRAAALEAPLTVDLGDDQLSPRPRRRTRTGGCFSLRGVGGRRPPIPPARRPPGAPAGFCSGWRGLGPGPREPRPPPREPPPRPPLERPPLDMSAPPSSPAAPL